MAAAASADLYEDRCSGRISTIIQNEAFPFLDPTSDVRVKMGKL